VQKTQILERREQAPPQWAVPRPSTPSLLGDERAQRAGPAGVPVLSFSRPKNRSETSSRLETLKRAHFRGQSREDRIARSLTALKGPQPTELDAEAWGWVAEDPDLADSQRQ